MKKRFSVTMEPQLVEGIDQLIREKVFASRSHALEKAVLDLLKARGARPQASSGSILTT